MYKAPWPSGLRHPPIKGFTQMVTALYGIRRQNSAFMVEFFDQICKVGLKPKKEAYFCDSNPFSKVENVY